MRAMNVAIPVALTAVLVALAAIHVYWAVTGSTSGRGVIPEVDGKPLFTPSRSATVLVAAALLVAAFIAASRGQLVAPAARGSLVHWAAVFAGVVFLLRAVGEFTYVGFFKRRRGTRFATLDTWLFSPLCTLIGLAFTYVAMRP